MEEEKKSGAQILSLGRDRHMAFNDKAKRVYEGKEMIKKNKEELSNRKVHVNLMTCNYKHISMEEKIILASASWVTFCTCRKGP